MYMCDVCSSGRAHTRGALVTGFQTCALLIFGAGPLGQALASSRCGQPRVCLGLSGHYARHRPLRGVGLRPNNSFKPKPLRYTKGMAGKACHAFGSTTRFGSTQALCDYGGDDETPMGRPYGFGRGSVLERELASSLQASATLGPVLGSLDRELHKHG